MAWPGPRNTNGATKQRAVSRLKSHHVPAAAELRMGSVAALAYWRMLWPSSQSSTAPVQNSARSRKSRSRDPCPPEWGGRRAGQRGGWGRRAAGEHGRSKKPAGEGSGCSYMYGRARLAGCAQRDACHERVRAGVARARAPRMFSGSRSDSGVCRRPDALQWEQGGGACEHLRLAHLHPVEPLSVAEAG